MWGIGPRCWRLRSETAQLGTPSSSGCPSTPCAVEPVGVPIRARICAGFVRGGRFLGHTCQIPWAGLAVNMERVGATWARTVVVPLSLASGAFCLLTTPPSGSRDISYSRLVFWPPRRGG